MSSASSPVLVGRDELLALGERRAAAIGERGHLLFVAGEAGIGKTRLVGAIVRQAERHGLRALSAAAFPRDIEASGALLFDLADQLQRSSQPGWPLQGDRIRRHLVRADRMAQGDADRHRRLVTLEIVEAVANLTAGGPVALALEDLHWADDLSLEVIAQLSRRLSDLPIFIIGSYRSDELYPRVPMREWRARLIGQRLAEETVVPRLGLDETRQLARFLVGGPLPPPSDLVTVLHQRTDGIPLHVEELLGAMASEGQPTEERLLPGTLTEAVSARAQALSPLARRVAEAAAIIGRSFDLELLTAVQATTSLASVSRAVAELQRRFFLVEVRPDWFDIRHALIRDALEGAIDPARRRRLHARVAAAAMARADVGSDAYLSAHFELAGELDRAFHHARLAAARASSISSHREALDLYRRAARTAPVTLPDRERAALIRSLAVEQMANDHNQAAVESLHDAHDLLVGLGDPVAAADLVPSLVSALHLLGHDLESRAMRIHAELDALGKTPPASTRARLLAALSAAFMLDRRLDEAIAHGEEALALARPADDSVTALNVETTLGSCLLFAGRTTEGWEMLERAVATARGTRREAEAARAYRMIGSSASVLVAYDQAERWLREGIDYAERTEQWTHRHYMTAHLGHVAWARGDWERASLLAEQALSDGRGGLTTRITSLHVLGYVALGRGDLDRARGYLSEAREHGERMRELQRLSPALWGLAECALRAGDAVEAVALADVARDASMAVGDAAYLFPFLVTGTRARLAAGNPRSAEEWVADVGGAIEQRGIPGTLPALDHARGLLALATGVTGQARKQLTAARRGWLALGRWWEAQWAGVDLALGHLRSNRAVHAIDLLEGVIADAGALGARPLLEASEDLMRRARARHATDEPWAPLSAREFEVARLIAEGLTNRQIADELTISPKTVSAHVEHILARLGASRRAEIAAWTTKVAR